MDDEHPNSLLTARDVAGAWLVCVLIAILALGLTSNLHGGMPPAATTAAEIAPCPPISGSVCPSSAGSAGNTVGFVTGLHRLAPMEPPGDKNRG